jgi:hypothetical protein
VVELLTGTGLSLSAGLNAYIPLLALGLLGRFSTLVQLPESWLWLTETWVLVILGILFVVELVADKVPAVDHLNDLFQTVVRPTSGGLVFVAGSGAQTPAITDPGEFFTSPGALPVILGVVLALAAHLVKASARPVVNLSTAGTGAPVMSVVEDITSATLSLLAILVPIFVVVFVAALVGVAVTAVRQRRRHRRRLIVPPGSRPP